MCVPSGIKFVAMFMAVGASCLGAGSNIQSQLREGDILFQTSRSSQSLAIQLATRSRWSHTGMIVSKKNRLYVLEAVQPVKLTPVEAWIKRGEGGRVLVKRLKDADSVLTPQLRERMWRVGKRFLGRPYDLWFEWSDQRIYCSELVWKIFKEGAGIEIGKLQRLRDFDLDHPEVRRILRQRYGSKLPLDEPVISPEAMADSPLLKTIE